MFRADTYIQFVKSFPVVILLLTLITAPAVNASDDLFRALFPGKLDLNLRSYYMKRSFDQGGQSTSQESLAAGGSLAYKTLWWHNLRGGLTVFTSQGLFFTDPDKEGTGLLGPRQTGYTVLGHAFLQGRVSKTELTVGRQELTSPFVNPYDIRMTPFSVEAYTIQSREVQGFTFLLSHVAKIKKWTWTTFEDMSDAAGLKGTHKPLTMAGALFEPGDNYKLQLWNYYCYDFMNVVYLQGDGSWKLKGDFTLLGAIQFLNQRDVGSGLGGSFNINVGGVRGTLVKNGIGLTLAYTATVGNHDIINPWGGYPGFTSIIEEDNDRAGEHTWLAGLSYDFSSLGIVGLNAFTNYTDSSTPKRGPNASPSQRELDFTLDYRFTKFLKGLWVRGRAAFVTQDKSMGGKEITDFRIIVNYPLPIDLF
jgi:hypothetical protein